MMSIRPRAWTMAWSGLLVSFAFLSPQVALGAADAVAKGAGIDCTAKCHQDVKFNSPAHPETKCAECHTNITQTPHDNLPAEQKLKADQVCAQCHGMAQKQLGKSVHEGKSCKTCHGKPHEVGVASNTDSRLSSVGQVETCGKCHDDVLEGFKSSVHGEGLLKSGLTEAAPSCSDCHGTHGIQKKGNEKAKMGHVKSPETCGACHQTVLKHWKDESAHGLAWQAGKKGPVCTDCHVDSHSIKDPTSAAMRKQFPNECGSCHKEGHRDLPRQLPRQGVRARLGVGGDVLRLPHPAPEPAGQRSALERQCGEPGCRPAASATSRRSRTPVS